MMKKILLSIISFLFIGTALTGGIFLLAGCDTSYSQENQNYNDEEGINDNESQIDTDDPDDEISSMSSFNITVSVTNPSYGKVSYGFNGGTSSSNLTSSSFTISGSGEVCNITATPNSGNILSSIGGYNGSTTKTIYCFWSAAYRAEAYNTYPNYSLIRNGSVNMSVQIVFSFEGWYTSSSGGSPVSSSTTMGSANRTIYAHWTPIVYTMALDNDFGSTKQSVSLSSDMTSWTKYLNSTTTTVTYNSSTSSNTYRITTGPSWEVMYKSISVTTNTTYGITFNYTVPSYNQYEKYPGISFQILSSLPSADMNYSKSLATIYLPRISTSGKATVMFNSSSYSRVYFIVNAGTVADNQMEQELR